MNRTPTCASPRQWGRIALVAFGLSIVAPVPWAVADYVQASRHAIVRSEPNQSGEVLLTVEAGAQLALREDTQDHGYYAVTLPSGEQGWVYRTLVRRFRGQLPAGSGVPASASSVGGTTSSADDEPDTSVASVDIGSAPSSPRSYDQGVVYASDPVHVVATSDVHTLDKTYFKVGYSEARGQPLWTCYAIGPATDFIAYPRRRFATDRETTALVSHDDYTGTDFSRGHMAPRLAISTRFGKAGNDATFVMSNVCPQFQDFNDGPWGNLEEWVAGKKNSRQFIKGWGDEYGKVWVTVGPMFNPAEGVLAGKVEVPSAYYCIVVDEEAGKPRALAFIMAHKDSRECDLQGSLRSIDEIERQTGLDFFKELPDRIEDPLERAVATRLWTLPVNPN